MLSPRSECRNPIGQAVAQIQHMGELVDDHVIRLKTGLACLLHIPPRQHDRAAFHPLARQFFAIGMDDAHVIFNNAARQHRAVVHHDALNPCVVVQAQLQHG